MAGESVAGPRTRPHPWSAWERTIIENWTGILGAILLVAGIGFLGIYTALTLSPFSRFAMIAGVSGVLVTGFYVLKQKENWLKLALWLRSSGGATFLFGCLGSGHMPGLQWVDDSQTGLALLLVGIGVNLYFGYAGGRQSIASLHVTLSVVALAVAPQNGLTLIVATSVTAFGVLLAFRSVRWDRHLAITLGSFALYHLYWHVSGQGLHAYPDRLAGILCNLFVGLFAALVHYQKEYQSKNFEWLPFTVHLMNWGFMGLGAYVNSLHSSWRTGALALAAAAAFGLARRGKHLGISWLYQTDTLIAQTIAMMAVLSAYSFVMDGFAIAVVLFVEVMIYVRVVAQEKEPLLRRAGLVVLHGLGVLLVPWGLQVVQLSTRPEWSTDLVMLVGGIALATLFHVETRRRWGERFDSVDFYGFAPRDFGVPVSILGVLIGLMGAVVTYGISHESWFEPAVVVLLGGLVVARSRWQSNGLGIGLLVAIITVSVLSWSSLVADIEMSWAERLRRVLPLLALSGLMIRLSYVQDLSAFVRWPGIYLLGGQLAGVAYVFLNPVSPLTTGIAWLLLSLGALEMANRMATRTAHAGPESDQSERYLLHVGYACIAGFVIRHILVDLQAEAYLGPFHARLLIEGFAIGAAVYWWAYRPAERIEQLASWRSAQPLFLEGALGLFVTLVILEVPEVWHAIGWALLALALLFLGRDGMATSRLRAYSVVMCWVTTAHAASVSSRLVTPSLEWFDPSWVSGGMAILLIFAYLWQATDRVRLESVLFPWSCSRLRRWTGRVSERKLPWLYYPVFLGVAIYLYAGFDKAILTLLWVVEAFVVFVLSIGLKEQHFRYVALSGLALCLIRLLVYDLAQSNTLTRAMVFVSVGVIMLLMHSVYNKFRNRFA